MSGLAKALTPDLREIHAQIEAIKLDATCLCDGMTDAQFNARPHPSKWSIGECLAHLIVSATEFERCFDVAIAAGREKRQLGNGPYRYGWLMRAFVRSMEPPPRFRTRTNKKFRPATYHDPAKTLAAFHEAQARLQGYLQKMAGLDLARVKAQSPFFKALRYPLGIALALHTAHERRHLWQAAQVKEQLDTIGVTPSPAAAGH